MVMFPEAEAGNGPVILQLRKWDLWQNQLNISEYREAFISPTRELLVLLSHQSEILLLPLTAGKLFSSTLAEREILDTSQSEDSGSRSDPVYDSPSISEPTSAFLHGSSLTAKKYYFVADVQSLAWGHCGDVYNRHKDVAFKELLVVSSDHGVTVHGFRYWDKKNDRIPSEPVGNGIMGGRWMEWDPSASIHSTEKDHHTEGSEGTENFCTSRNCSSKKWLKTFLTEIETVESEGNFVMRFPKKSSFPSSAEVVSFNIFFSSSTFLNFLAQVNPEMDEKENQSQGIKVELEKGSFNLDASSDEGVSIGPLLKCSRVFSSSSHRLVGFVLTVTKPLPIKTSEEGRNAGKVIVVVAVVYWWGIQWICSVRLWDSCPSLGHHGEWTDFKFSDKLLVCLHSSGLISLWDATSGKFVAELDVLHCSGLNLGTNSVVKQSELSAEADITPKIVDFSCNRRTFKRLMVAFNSSLLAVVDECGVVYVLCADDYILEKHYSFNKIVPHFLHCGLGLLAGWDVAGSEISGQRILSDISNVQDLIGNESFPFAVHRDDLKLQKKKRLHLHGKGSRHESHLTCFSSSSTAKLSNISTSQISSAPIRRIFLPMHGCNREDPICFSPLGVTRLVNRCTKTDQRSTVIDHTSLHLHSAVLDDRGLSKSLQSRSSCFLWKELFGETIGCSFQGCLYLVTKDGLFIVLPFVSLSWEVPAVESIGNWQPSTITNGGHQIGKSVRLEESEECWQPWIVEVLGRALLYEGPAEADHICLENGWDVKITRMHRLHLALHFMKFEEIEQSLEMLVDVNLAEEGVLRLIFTAVYQISSKIGRDNEVAVSLRLLALAACFAIKMIRRYGLVEHKKDEVISPSIRGLGILYLESVIPKRTEIGNLRKLKEMAHFLEIIRNLQCCLSAKSRRPSQGVVDSREGLALADPTVSLENLHLPIVNVDAMPDALEAQSRADLSYLNTEKLDFLPEESSSVPSSQLDSGITHEIIAHMPHGGGIHRKKPLPLENPKDMIARWKVGNLDLKTIVKDALQSDRLPLAVLQLHLQRSKDLAAENEPHDSFSEVRDVGRAIAYDLFLKGETGLAVATLQRLGEDIELSLRQLLFGTVRRSLRIKIAEEMKMWGYLGPHESRILDRIALIERLYPSSTFWGTFLSRQKQLGKESSGLTLPEANVLQFTCSEEFNSFMIECGEIDGVVIGSWKNLDQSSSHPMVDEDNLPVGYWASAAVWSDSWDQKTIDRIILDQPFLMGVNVLWESQLEYHICHNDWEEVLKLLDMIPATLLSNGSLQISLDGLHSAASIGPYEKLLDHADYFCPVEELEAVCINVPNVKIFTLSVDKTCSGWLRTLVEQELAKRFIFMKDYWEGTEEIIALLARTGFFTNTSKNSLHSESTESSTVLDVFNFCEEFCSDTVQALHRLVIHHCSRYNLPNLLDLYLDHQELILDNDSVGSLLEAAGECQWAKWLLLSRIKGREYDASFSNARSVISRNIVHGSNLSVPEIDEIIQNVDDMAEGRGELAALATLMYAPAPVQQCIYSGSVNRHYSSSAQCTLENLRPSLQHFPTLWHSLVSACFGQDPSDSSFGFSAKSGFHKSALSDYLNWRETVFTSASGDTSLLQMLPYWFSKSLRRLVQIFIQGPLGWQSIGGTSHIEESFIHRDIHFNFAEIENIEGSAISWEVAIQKNIEELFASSFESTEFGVEHHLHRGRALAAFNHLVAARAQNLKLSDTRQDPSATSVPGQNNIQSDVQTLLAPFTQDEESLLSAVMPLAVMHFEESVLVASCAFLLELCGLSASMLRVDVAALCRISSFYKSIEYKDHYNNHIMSKGSAFHPLTQEGELTVSLARALADDYLQHDTLRAIGRKDTSSKVEATQRPSRALISVLQHLEKASLPSIPEGNTCGSWLLSGTGDGAEFRSLQKAASLHWSLVTTFCQMHHLPLSTKYLSVLAKDNDWVGFLKEAQFAGFPFDVIVQVATKEFSDPRLKIHILNVLRSLQSARKKTGSATNSTFIGRSNEISLSGENIVAPVELFGLLGECEKQKNPGEALLLRAKDLHWSLLAMIASCFPDVSPLACLTVWLEITAARETSSIKVNDISSQIANKVGAAVQATNSLPPNSRALTFHYNRRNPKRRHLVEPLSVDVLDGALFNVSTTYSAGSISAAQENMAVEGKRRAQEQLKIINDPDEGLTSLTKMVAVLCEQHLFLPLLRAFEMFLPSCSLLPFIRFLQAYSQMRLTDATNHINHFSGIFKDERPHLLTNPTRDCPIGAAWIGSTAVKAADAVLSTCPSPYEKRCLLHLLSSADFGDGGSSAARFRRLYWKINIAEPSLRREDGLYLGNETIDDDSSLLAALEKNGDWERARSWARQLEASGGPWMNVVHHVTETQAEEMVAEWKEFLWDVPEERAALWGHCQTLFIRHRFSALQAGLFFLRHAEDVEKDIPAKELHEMLLLSLQWLSGTIDQTNPVYPLHLIREIETRVWLLAVESEAQAKAEGDFTITANTSNVGGGTSTSIIEQTAGVIARMDAHINTVRSKVAERSDLRDNNGIHFRHPHGLEVNSHAMTGSSSTKMKRRAKSYLPSRRLVADTEKIEIDDTPNSPRFIRNNGELFRSQEENMKIESSVSAWEERVGPAELERAVLSLLEFGQVTAAKQLHHKLSPSQMPSEFVLVDTTLKLASILSPSRSGEASLSLLDAEAHSVIQSHGILNDDLLTDPFQVLETLAAKCTEGSGRGLCKRIIAVVKAANVLGLSFSEAFEKRPIELLQLLSLKAQDSFEEAKLLVQTHFMPPASIAQILAESFLKGLLAAHRGGYMDSQKEEGPAPLLWRFSDFLKWAELCPLEPEIGHALMRLVITGQEIPHACEVELLILSHHFYKSSACLDGVDVLVALAATRVESYVSEGDFPCLARLITGVSNFRALNFILGILIENGQLELLLHKYSAADTSTSTAEAVRGFRMAVLTSLKHFNPHDLDAFAMVYNHFDMKHETASLLESRATQSMQLWFYRYDKERNEELLDSMRYFIEAAEVHSTMDAGNKTRRACAQASLLSLQIRMPDFDWLNLSETNARRALVEQSRFQEALIVAEAYTLNQPSEWALVLWNQMLKPELTEQFVAEFVAVLPLQPSMLMELARFYRAEVAARGDQSHFSVWLSPGGMPAEWARHLGRSFRSLLKRTRDLRLRVQLATIATGFIDVIDACMKVLDRVPDMAGPLVLRKGHGGAYLPLM